MFTITTFTIIRVLKFEESFILRYSWVSKMETRSVTGALSRIVSSGKFSLIISTVIINKSEYRARFTVGSVSKFRRKLCFVFCVCVCACSSSKKGLCDLRKCSWIGDRLSVCIYMYSYAYYCLNNAISRQCSEIIIFYSWLFHIMRSLII